MSYWLVRIWLKPVIFFYKLGSCSFKIWEKNRSANIVKLTFYVKNILHWILSDLLKIYCSAQS